MSSHLKQFGARLQIGVLVVLAAKSTAMAIKEPTFWDLVPTALAAISLAMIWYYLPAALGSMSFTVTTTPGRALPGGGEPTP